MTDLPKGWAAVTLEQIAVWGSGGTPDRKRADYYGGGIPWVKTGELGQMFVCDTEETLSPLGLKNSSAKVYPAGSVGIAMYGATIGKVSIWAIDAATNQACAVAEPCPDVTFTRFLYYLLASIKRGLVSAGKGGAQPNISQGLLREWPVLLPPLPEQHRIVAKIEALFSELEAGEASLTRARAQLSLYRQSLLKAAFQGKLTAGWRAANLDKLEPPETLLSRIRKERDARYKAALDDWQTALSEWRAGGEVGERPSKPRRHDDATAITADELYELGTLPYGWGWFRPVDLAAPTPHSIGIGPFGSNLKVSDYCTDGVPLVFVKNITRRDFKRDLKFVTHLKASELNAHSALPNDILITKMGDPPGDCAIYPADAPVAIITADCLKFRVWEDFLDRRFAAYAIASLQVQRQLGLLTRGVAQKKISVDRFKTIAIPVPSIAEQIQLANRLDAQMSVLEATESEITTALAKITALRQSILKQAFSGQLVPQDPADEPASALLARLRAQTPEAKPRRKKTA